MPGQRGLQPGEDDLGLGVAEAGVELDDPDATAGDRQTGVQQAGEGGAAAAHLVDGRLQDGLHDLVDQLRVGPRQRGVRAHAAGVGARVAVECALEVLGGLERAGPCSPSVMAKRETSGPSRNSSITTRSQALACALAASRSSVTTTPLPAASPSSLTTYGVPKASRASAASAGVVQTYDRAVGTSAPAMTALAKAFEPSSCAASLEGPKTGMPASRTASATPATSGASGPTTTRSAPSSHGQRGHGRAVEGVDLVQFGDLGDAGVAGSAVERADVGV